MPSRLQGPVVDADGHVLEPADTWLKYIDPQYRDRAIRSISLTLRLRSGQTPLRTEIPTLN